MDRRFKYGAAVALTLLATAAEARHRYHHHHVTRSRALVHISSGNQISIAGVAKSPAWTETFTGPLSANWERHYSPWDIINAHIIYGSHEREIYADNAYLGYDTLRTGSGGMVISAQRMPAAVRKAVDAKIAAEHPPAVTLPSLKQADWVSAMVKGKTAFLYGYIEGTIRADGNPSGWPAFWMLPEKFGWPPEIDIMEIPGDGMVHQTLHSLPGDPPPHPSCKTPLGSTQTFHRYGVLWTAATITFYFDGQPTCRFPTPPDMHQPKIPLLNLAVGGWAKPPTAATREPMTMEVQSVSYYPLTSAK